LGWKYSENDFYFNSGVLFVKDTDDTHQFYEYWHSLWRKNVLKGINYDQPSLAKANELMGCKICKLDDIWNCQINAKIRSESLTERISWKTGRTQRIEHITRICNI
jgi:hypothetical protein